MIKKGDCKWYNSGTYEITPSKGDKITIDFGDGACDNKATLTKGSIQRKLRWVSLKSGKYSVVLKSNGKEYKQTAIIHKSWKWPVGNLDMQKP